MAAAQANDVNPYDLLDLAVSLAIILGTRLMARSQGASPMSAGGLALVVWFIARLCVVAMFPEYAGSLSLDVWPNGWRGLLLLAACIPFSRRPFSRALWVCPNCTYTNKDHKASCVACKTARPTDSDAVT
jgi:hypothetical protein